MAKNVYLRGNTCQMDMKKGRTLFLTIRASVLAAPSATAQDDDHQFQLSSNLEVFHTMIRELDMYYVDTLNPKSTIERGIQAMLAGIDPYTVYYPEADMKDLKMMTTGKYAGIGSIIRQYKDHDYIYIEEPYENMPAAKAGLRAGDEILRIDGESMKGKESQYVSDHLRGDAGTSLVVTVRRPGVADSLDFTLERSVIAMPAVPYYGMKGGFGYILLESFTENCSRQVMQAMVELKEQGAKGLILDLRGNGGGLLNEAIDIVGLFVPKGTLVVETKGKTPQSMNTCRTTRNPIDTEIPLVVMIDGESASASEIVAGCLQDLDRAVVLGSRSFGKGLVQSTRMLPFNGTLKLTTAKYYIPSGRCIQEIDYSKRNSKGQAEHIPDSLTKVFYTAAGREVRDGGGIRPDVECIPDTIPDLLYALSQDYVLFEFVNEFCRNHNEIAPMEEFELDKSVYDSFIDYVRKSDFKFTSSSSKALESLRKLAKMEGLSAKASAEFDALEAKLQYDLNSDLDIFNNDLKRVLAMEIAARYYYQKGAISQSLKGDKFLDSAIQLLGDGKRYRAILTSSIPAAK